MILSIFRTNQLLIGALLIFYILLLRVSVFIVPYQWEPLSRGIWAEHVLGWVGTEGIVSQAIAVLLLLSQALIINSLVARHRLRDEVNLFPGLFYILVASAIPDFLYLSPLLIANTFLLIAISELFQTYKAPSCADRIFNVGFWIGIAGLFYYSYLVFIIWGLIGLNILRAFRLRERIILIVGSLMPYMLLGLYYFWFDRFGYFMEAQFSDNIAILDFRGISGIETRFKIVVFAILLIIVLLSSGRYQSKKIIQVQKKITILFWVLGIAILTIVFQSGIRVQHLFITTIPLGIFLSFNFSDLKNKWAESLHLILLVLVLAWQFKSLLV